MVFVALPLRNHDHQVVAAISIAGPTERVTKERVEGPLAEEILKQSKLISKKLGYIK